MRLREKGLYDEAMRLMVEEGEITAESVEQNENELLSVLLEVTAKMAERNKNAEQIIARLDPERRELLLKLLLQSTPPMPDN